MIKPANDNARSSARRSIRIAVALLRGLMWIVVSAILVLLKTVLLRAFDELGRVHDPEIARYESGAAPRWKELKLLLLMTGVLLAWYAFLAYHALH